MTPKINVQPLQKAATPGVYLQGVDKNSDFNSFSQCTQAWQK